MKTQLTLAAISLLCLGCANSNPTTTASSDPLPQEAPVAQAAPEAKTVAPTKGSHPSPGKPQAPVAISLSSLDGRSVVQVNPGTDAKDLSISLKGIDGLDLGREGTLRRVPSLRSGETLDLAVTPLGEEPRGTLVVTVEGSFAGVNRGAVKSFPIGGPKVQEDSGAVETGLGPVMPAGGE